MNKKLIFISIGLMLISSVAWLSFKTKANDKIMTQQALAPRLPIVYSDSYDISLLPKILQWFFHSFDGRKYSKVVKYLIDKHCITENQIVPAIEVTNNQLSRIHTSNYMNDLENNTAIKMAAIAEVPLIGLLPDKYVFNRLVKPMRMATGGTIQAMHLALQYGWAINLSGGYHHATIEVERGGFCALADIPLAIYEAFDVGVKRVLIVDLDAHRGNGHEEILAQDNRVFIFDMYRAGIYPGPKTLKEKINFDYPISNKIKDKEYLGLLKNKLPKAIEQCNPELMMYNAGTDIFEKDDLGQMGVTKQGIIERDAFVFQQAKLHNIPIVMVLSGGYTSESARIIGESIENLMKSGMLKMPNNQEQKN